VAAGLLDRVVEAPELAPTARSLAESVATLDLAAHAATKLRVRQAALDRIRAAIDAELSRAAG
jgi:enoyl-CoA hydratase